MRRVRAQLRAVAGSDLRPALRAFVASSAVGAACGLAGALFVSAIQGVESFALGTVVGLHLARPAGEGGGDFEIGHGWLPLAVVPLVTAFGGLLCGLIARRLGDDVYGGGTDPVIRAYHEGRADLGWKAPLGKGLGAVAVLGTGGSAGRESPVALVGAGVGSGVGRLLRAPARERRGLALAGMAAALSAVFRIPLGGTLFALEVLYRGGLEGRALLPCLVASVSGFAVFGSIHGSGHLFDTPPTPEVPLAAIPLYALVGLFIVPFGYLFVAALRGAPRAFAATGLPTWLRPAAGGLVLGLLALAHPDFLGIGYGWVQKTLSSAAGNEAAGLAFAGFVLFAVGKTAATALTVGSGGAGGTFAPAVVVGGFLGASVGTVVHALAPELAPEPAAFALVGMGAFLGGVARVPLAAIVIVCELVGSYSLLVPIMVAVGVSFPLLGRTTLFPAQIVAPHESERRRRNARGPRPDPGEAGKGP